MLIFPTLYATTGGLILHLMAQLQRGHVGGVYRSIRHRRRDRCGDGGLPPRGLDRRLAPGVPFNHDDIEEAAIEGAVQRLRPKLMAVCAVLASLIPILWESGIGSDVIEADCRSHRGRHAYFHHPRFDPGPCFSP